MARFAPVAPIHILKEMATQNVLGNYHLLLAHDVVKHPNECAEIFDHEHQFDTVIMDNSVAELGEAVDLKMVIEAVQITQANVIVLPDAYLDMQRTIDDCARALPSWRSTFQEQLTHQWSFMMVPQGRTIQEWTKCAEQFGKQGQKINWWGIPRNLTDLPTIGTRLQAIKIASAVRPDRHIHLLGFSDNMIDDVICSKEPAVNGIDSAVPLRIPEPFSMTAKVGPRGDWWEKGQFTLQTKQNLETIRNLVRLV